MQLRRIFTTIILFVFCFTQTICVTYGLNSSANNGINNINYKSQITNITKEAAISLTYGINIENNPSIIEIYNIARKNPAFSNEDIDSLLTIATKSYGYARIKGLWKRKV